MKRSIVIALLTHALSKYDLYLFGLLAPTLAPIFFPTTDNFLDTLIPLSTFAAGYFFRPIGAIILSNIGDKYGRRKAFLLASFITIFSSILIGIIPSYDIIGIWASIFIITARLLQGFSAGGEYSGAIVFIGEHTKHNRPALAASLIRAVGFIGIAIGTIVAAISTSSAMPTWGWRITFIIGGMISLIAFLLRTYLQETPDFINLKKKKLIHKNFLIMHVLKENYRNILLTIMVMSCGYILSYFSTIYFNVLYKSTFALSTSKTMFLNTGVTLLWACTSIMAGFIADKIGVEKFVRYMAIIVIFSIILVFHIIFDPNDLTRVILSQCAFSIISCLYFSPLSALLIHLFPTNQRYSSIAFSSTIAQACLGGTTPLICASMVEYTGNPKAFIYWLLFSGLIGYLGIRFLRNNGV